MISITETPDWDALFEKLKFTEREYIRLIKVIVNGMIDRIKNQETSLGEPLDENSPRWIATKMNLNAPPNPLQFTGGLTEGGTYQLEFDENNAYITLIPSYREIHLDLIEISERTGKNYRDWFGIHEDDVEIIMEIAKEFLNRKIREL
jgi:hypothetical protein